MSGDGSSIAVVGAGPKGLYCLERLTIELAQTDFRPDTVHVFEPHPVPGAGPVYEPTQPHYLRLNFANENIDAWSRDGSALPVIDRPSFLEHLARKHPDLAQPAGYAPRALVGEYLSSVFAAVIAALGELTAVEIHREAVQSISATDGRFDIATAVRTVTCDEVLVATGHASRRTRNTPEGADHSLGPYPIEQPGGVVDVTPGTTVAVRGLGLTAIDVVLALTEGRGGTFEQIADRPGRLRYHPSPLGPRLVLPFSRTGRPMVPKDHPTFGSASQHLDHLRGRGTGVISTLEGSPTEVLDALERVIVETATGALAAATARAPDRIGVGAFLEDLLERRPIQVDRARADLESAVDVAHGWADPGPEWALGTAWRMLYPAIVELFAGRGLDPVWDRFGLLAAEMERLAFGPPAENAARFLALVEAGVVDLSMAAGPELAMRGGRPVIVADQVVEVDHVVHAVLAPPGIAPGPSPLIASLLAGGLATQMPHAPGLRVLRDGTCVGRSGSPTDGLAAVGRPTEGCVLGNDTLSRTLHDTPRRWARAVVRRLADRKDPAFR